MSATATETAMVYKSIAAVQSEIAKVGVDKAQKNSAQNYKFRGIDDIYNTLAPMLPRNRLCILPRVLARNCVERDSKGGGKLFYVCVEVEYDLVSIDDGSKHTVKTFGEAMDSGDKATNKAMSAAYKYMAIETFCIPTEGDNDADASSPEVAAGKSTGNSNGNGSGKAGNSSNASNGNGSNGSGSSNGNGNGAANGNGSAPLVNKKQVEEIRALCIRKGVTGEQLHKRFNIDSLAKLTLSQYGIIKSGLSKKPDAKSGDNEPADNSDNGVEV